VPGVRAAGRNGLFHVRGGSQSAPIQRLNRTNKTRPGCPGRVAQKTREESVRRRRYRESRTDRPAPVGGSPRRAPGLWPCGAV
jgi:hypothetical protein